jgi:hypothetical protein
MRSLFYLLALALPLELLACKPTPLSSSALKFRAALDQLEQQGEGLFSQVQGLKLREANLVEIELLEEKGTHKTVSYKIEAQTVEGGMRGGCGSYKAIPLKR